jgi:hypothetical protein
MDAYKSLFYYPGYHTGNFSSVSHQKRRKYIYQLDRLQCPSEEIQKHVKCICRFIMAFFPAAKPEYR